MISSKVCALYASYNNHMMVYPALYTSTFFSANTQGNISGAAARGEMSSKEKKHGGTGEREPKKN